jgi:hypothetical protein
MHLDLHSGNKAKLKNSQKVTSYLLFYLVSSKMDQLEGL